MAKVQCFNDANCTGTLVCYSDPAWASPGSPKQFCDCENWYGTTGEDCLSLGTGAIVALSVQVIGLLCNLRGLIVAFLITRTFLRMPKADRVKHIVATSISIVLCFTCAASAIYFGVEIAIWFTPEEHVNFEESSILQGPAKVHSLLTLERTILQILVSFVALQGLTMPLCWIEMFLWVPVLDSSRILVETHGYEIAVLVLDLMYIVFTTAFEVGESTLLYNAFNCLVLIGAAVIYVRLPRKLVRTVSDLNKNDGRLSLLLRRLEVTRTFMLIDAFIFLICGVANLAVVTIYRNFHSPGEVSTGWLCYTVVIIGLQILIYSILYHVWTVKRNYEDEAFSQHGVSQQAADQI